MKSEWNSCQLCVASTSADLPPSLHGCMEPDTHVEIPSHDRLHRSEIGRHIILNRKHVHYFFAQSQANTLCLLSGITYVYSLACWPQSCWSYSLETWNYIYIFNHFSTLTMCLQYKSIPGEDNKVYSAKWISWMLLPWRLMSPGQQQPCYCLCPTRIFQSQCLKG